MTKTIARLGIGVAAALVVTASLVGCAGEQGPLSLYTPELKRDLTQAERWKLDFELMNEAYMKDHNSRRFDAPGSFDKRAEWFEATARWYPIADVMQQLIDFRKSKTRNDEAAFNRLVELGQQGDIGAKCLASMLYRHHSEEVTRRWKYSFAYVVTEALKVKDSGHPVCSGIEGFRYLSGDLGYPKNEKLAKAGLIKSALAGFYGSQRSLSGMHLEESLRFKPKHVALNLCWLRVAEQQSPVSSTHSLCETYRFGVGHNEDLKPVPLPPRIQEVARQWCEPSRQVTARTCADLENELDKEENK